MQELEIEYRPETMVLQTTLCFELQQTLSNLVNQRNLQDLATIDLAKFHRKSFELEIEEHLEMHILNLSPNQPTKYRKLSKMTSLEYTKVQYLHLQKMYRNQNSSQPKETMKT